MRHFLIACWLALAGSYAHAAQDNAVYENENFGKTMLCSGGILEYVVTTLHLQMDRTDHLATLSQAGVSCEFYEYGVVRQVQQFGNGRADSDNKTEFCAKFTEFILKDSGAQLFRWEWLEPCE